MSRPVDLVKKHYEQLDRALTRCSFEETFAQYKPLLVNVEFW